MTDDRHARQAPGLDGGGGQDGRDAAGRHPAPPIADAGQRREDRRCRAETLPCTPPRCHRRGSATSAPVRSSPGPPHSSATSPTISSSTVDAALARDRSLPREQGGDQEQALVAAPHRQRDGSEPADQPRMRARLRDTADRWFHARTSHLYAIRHSRVSSSSTAATMPDRISDYALVRLPVYERTGEFSGVVNETEPVSDRAWGPEQGPWEPGRAVDQPAAARQPAG